MSVCGRHGGYGYLRWLRNEKSVRLKEDLPYIPTAC